MLRTESRRRSVAAAVAFGTFAAFGLAPGLGSGGLAEPPSAAADDKPIPVEPCNGIGTPGDCRGDKPIPVEPCEGTGAAGDPGDCPPTISDLRMKNGSIHYSLSEQVRTVRIRISWRDSSGVSFKELAGPGKAGANKSTPRFKERVDANRLHIVVRATDRDGNAGRAAISCPVPDRFSSQ